MSDSFCDKFWFNFAKFSEWVQIKDDFLTKNIIKNPKKWSFWTSNSVWKCSKYRHGTTNQKANAYRRAYCRCYFKFFEFFFIIIKYDPIFADEFAKSPNYRMPISSKFVSLNRSNQSAFFRSCRFSFKLRQKAFYPFVDFVSQNFSFIRIQRQSCQQRKLCQHSWKIKNTSFFLKRRLKTKQKTKKYSCKK